MSATTDRLGSIVERELARAEGADSDELQSIRAEALKYYFGKARGDEVAGRSAVISTDVADMTNALLAMLTPMLSVDCVAEFEPNDDADEAQAAAESYAVNKLIVEDNQGFIQIQTALKDGLLMKNGCAKVWVEDEDSLEVFSVAGADAAEIAAFVERTDGEHDPDNETVAVPRTERRFRVAAVPIENISYQAGYSGPLQGIRFFAERMDKTRSDLVAMGLDRKLVDGLPSGGPDDNAAALQRNIADTGDRDAETRDQDVIEVHEAYVLVDLDDDGISERYKVTVANRGTYLDHERVDLLPYALGSPFLNPHRITGESIFDHLKATQDVKTLLVRQLLDNVQIVNNGRYAYDPNKVAEADVLTPTAGGGIRTTDVSAIVPLMVPDVTGGILAALTYEDKRRTERGGAALEMMGADMQLAGETAHGVERQYASREALASMIATNFAETLLRGIWTLTHEFLRRYSREPVMVKLNGTYQPMDPRQWPKRTRLNVTPGMTPGQRGHLQAALSQHIQFQLMAMQAGGNGVLMDATTVYRTSHDLLRLAGIPNPDRYGIDPSSPRGQQGAQAAGQAAQAAQAEQRALQQAALRIEAEKIASRERIEAGKLDHAYFDTETDAEIAEAKITAGAIEGRRNADRNRPERADRGAPRIGEAGA